MKKEDHDTTMEAFYDCTEEIANVIQKYYPEVYIEDMERINSLVDQELVDAMRKQAKENYLENINGGSK